jgi:hypothetical protein
VATWASETWASSEARQAQRQFASSLTVSAPSSNAANTAIRLAQAVPSDPEALRQALDLEHQGAEMLSRELGTAKHDLRSLLAQIKEQDGAAQEKSAAERSGGELRKSLLRERAERLDRDLSRMRRDGEPRMLHSAEGGEETKETKQAAENGAVELRKSLQQERDRAEQLAQSLASAKREVETQKAVAAKANDEAGRLKQVADSGAAELKQSLRQEHERAEALAQEVSSARATISAYEAQAPRASEQAEELKRAAENGAVELRKSLQQERDRAERLAQSLASAKHDLETQVALAEAGRSKQVADSGAAELKQSLRQEHERGDALANELSTARAKVYAYEAQALTASEQAEELKNAAENGAVELRKSLQQERDRAEQLAQSLASAKREVETQKAVAAKANDEAGRSKQVAESGAAELKQSLRQEHERAEALAQEVSSAWATISAYEAQARNASDQEQGPRDLAPERSKKDAQPVVANAGLITHGKASNVGTTKPAGADQTRVAEAESETRPHARDAAEAARLVARASVLLGQGDIGSARIVLERVAETGSAQANFALAETYDPLILPKWGTFGTRGDTTKAREFYTKAEASGVKEAKQRFDALPR